MRCFPAQILLAIWSAKSTLSNRVFRMDRRISQIVILLILYFGGFIMAKNIIICIDGTNNDPNDAIERYGESGLLEDNSISN